MIDVAMSSTQRRPVRTASARGQGVRGWCPRHDHVYAFRDGLCPECGTSLVPIDPAPPPEHEIEIITAAPPATPKTPSPRSARVLVGLVVLGAFLLGLLVARDGPSAPVATGPQARVSQNVRVYAISDSSAGALRLVRLRQNGDSFTAIFLADEGFPDPGAIAGAAVEVQTRDSGGVVSDFGVSDQNVAPLSNGFTVAGRLPTGSGRIVQLRISSIQLRVHETPAWSIDLSSVWPVRGVQPKVLHVGTSRPAGSGSSLRLVAVLGWHDRIEADFELRGLRAGEIGTISIDGLEMSISGEGDGLQDSWRTTLSAVQQEQISPAEILARFEGVPIGARRVTIRATRVSRFLAGPWTWTIA